LKRGSVKQSFLVVQRENPLELDAFLPGHIEKSISNRRRHLRRKDRAEISHLSDNPGLLNGRDQGFEN
jgi:hypothetical protein